MSTILTSYSEYLATATATALVSAYLGTNAFSRVLRYGRQPNQAKTGTDVDSATAAVAAAALNSATQAVTPTTPTGDLSLLSQNLALAVPLALSASKVRTFTNLARKIPQPVQQLALQVAALYVISKVRSALSGETEKPYSHPQAPVIVNVYVNGQAVTTSPT